MTLPSSGLLSLSNVRTEFGGNLPLNLSSLLRGNASKLVHSSNTAIPASAPMSLSNFYGSSRSGYYPMTIGRWGTPGDEQQGYHVTAGGSISFNNNYKGYALRGIVWNENGKLIGVGFELPNVPQSLLTYLVTSVIGIRTVTGYSPDFYGTTLFVFGTSEVSPFAAPNTLDTSIAIY